MQSFEEKIQALKLLFFKKIPEKMAEVEVVMQQLDSEPLNHTHWDHLHLLMHTLAGASGSFGFEELGARASAIKKNIRSLIASSSIDKIEGRDLLQADVRQFVQWARAHVE